MRITLLRHSIAERVDNDDFNRPLTTEGIEKAESLAASMRGLDVDVLICSPALRTMQTAKPIALELNIELRFEPRLYNASLETMKKVVEELETGKHLLIVGHNPGISQLAAVWDRSIYNSFEPCHGATFEHQNNNSSLVRKWPQPTTY